MNLSILLRLFFTTTCSSPEQAAFNYFATEILEKNYPKTNKIYFSGSTEIEGRTFGPFVQCAISDSSATFSQAHSQMEYKKNIKYNLFNKFKISSKIKENTIYVKVYNSIEFKNIYYTYIKFYKVNHFVDHYLIKISSDSTKAIETCLVKEII